MISEIWGGTEMPETSLPDVSVSRMLPFGVTLRPLLVQSSLSDSDLNMLLRERGIYVGDVEKQKLVPLIMKTIISPQEFELLLEKQTSKEDAPKRRNIQVDSTTQTSLFAALKDYSIDNAEAIPATVQNSKIFSPIAMEAVSENEITLAYKIKREDLTKDWVTPSSVHNGAVTLIKDPSTSTVRISSEYTSQETDDINRRIIKLYTDYLRKRGEIGNEENRILPEDFTNRERFNFLLRIASDTENRSLVFSGINDLEIGPDRTNPPPNGNGLMTENVRKMILNGKQLENNLALISDDEKEHLMLRSLQVDCDVNFQGKGYRCRIEYGFMRFFRNQNTTPEFQYSVPWIKTAGSSNETAVRKFVMETFEHHKDIIYQQMMIEKENKS